jgi:hypothetical protein
MTTHDDHTIEAAPGAKIATNFAHATYELPISFMTAMTAFRVIQTYFYIGAGLRQRDARKTGLTVTMR